jgi:hypothetical protein
MLRRARFCGAVHLGNDIARNAFMTATHTLQPSTAMRVLLVDDSKTERRLAERALAQDAYEVVTADCAQAALLALDGAGFNLIISDQRLPDLPGVALLGMGVGARSGGVRGAWVANTTLCAGAGALGVSALRRDTLRPLLAEVEARVWRGPLTPERLADWMPEVVADDDVVPQPGPASSP